MFFIIRTVQLKNRSQLPWVFLLEFHHFGVSKLLLYYFWRFLKLNKVIAFAFSNVSFAPLIPFIIYCSLKIGSYFIKTEKQLQITTSMTFADVQNHIYQYLVGSFVFATIMAVIFGTFSYFLLTFFSNFRNKN